MAIKYPHVSTHIWWKPKLISSKASVLGIDLAPVPIDPSSFPPNLSFQIYDVNSGLGHLEGQIDLVQMRCMSSGLKDVEKTGVEMQRCLKPGGLLLAIEGDKALLNEERKTITPMMRLPGDGGAEITSVSEQGSWFRRMIWGA